MAVAEWAPADALPVALAGDAAARVADVRAGGLDVLAVPYAEEEEPPQPLIPSAASTSGAIILALE